MHGYHHLVISGKQGSFSTDLCWNTPERDSSRAQVTMLVFLVSTVISPFLLFSYNIYRYLKAPVSDQVKRFHLSHLSELLWETLEKDWGLWHIMIVTLIQIILWFKDYEVEDWILHLLCPHLVGSITFYWHFKCSYKNTLKASYH